MNKDATIIFIFVIICLFLIKKIFYNETVKVVSDIDGQYYTVKKGKNSKKTANALALMNKNIELLFDHLYKGIGGDLYFFEKLRKRYKPRSIVENIDLANTSYTINKGEEIAFCLTKRSEKEELYDMNLLMFVCIHELAHVASESIGHTDEFKMIFKILLDEAIKCGVYKFENYTKTPKEYCGIIIKDTPVNY
jgi:hypothetical protein